MTTEEEAFAKHWQKYRRRPKARSALDEQKVRPLRKSLVFECKSKTTAKTYNSGYSLVVTHLTTNPPVRCLNRAERTGSLVFNVLWSYVLEVTNKLIM
jgi:hypothetical protein